MKFDKNELKIIQKSYEEGLDKFKRHSITSSMLGVIVLVIPPKIWNIIGLFSRRRHRRDFEASEFMFEDWRLIVLVLFVVIGFSTLSYFGYVHYFKKDLKYKEKITGTFKVVRVEHYSQRLSKELDGLDTALHFEKNDKKIKKYVFKKALNPEYVNAKAILVERAKYSCKVFKSEIVI